MTQTLTKHQVRQAVKHLKAGHKLLAKPDVWIQGDLGRDKDGNKVDAVDDNCSLAPAVQVCSIGALSKVARRRGYESTNLPAARFLACAINPELMENEDADADADDAHTVIVNFNDSNNHETVLNAWKDAIGKARRTLNKMEK